MGRFIPGCGRVGDGPERGSTRIERVFREEAMRGIKAVFALCQCSEAWLAVLVPSLYEDPT